MPTSPAPLLTPILSESAIAPYTGDAARQSARSPRDPAPADATLPAAARGLGQRRIVLRVLAGSLLMALAAHVAVPFWPVPLTLQTLALLSLGAALGPLAAAGAVLAWIAEGAIGLPVFAGGLGAGVLLGPTGGYILGYLPAALLAGLAARPGRRGAALKAGAAFLAAEMVLFACGVGWLAHLIGWERAVAGGLTPFLLGEALKIGLATAGALALARRRA